MKPLIPYTPAPADVEEARSRFLTPPTPWRATLLPEQARLEAEVPAEGPYDEAERSVRAALRRTEYLLGREPRRGRSEDYDRKEVEALHYLVRAEFERQDLLDLLEEVSNTVEEHATHGTEQVVWDVLAKVDAALGDDS